MIVFERLGAYSVECTARYALQQAERAKHPDLRVEQRFLYLVALVPTVFDSSVILDDLHAC